MLLRNLLRDDRGQDLIEYALLTAIVTLTGVVVFTTVRTKMGNAYTSWVNGAAQAWEPCPPGASPC